MNNRILRLNLKRLTMMVLSLSISVHSWMNHGMIIQAEPQETVELKVINQGVFKEGMEEPIVLPMEEENVLWINAEMETVYWKIHIDGELSEIQSVELFREDETKQVVTLDIQHDYYIPLEDLEYTGNYILVVKDLEGNVSETKQFVKIDRKVPILKEFSVEANSDTKFYSENGIEYAFNTEGDDVKITVAIDDNGQYFQKDKVLLEYSIDGKKWETIKPDGDWIVSEREQKLICGFDGEELEENTYQFRVSYADCANNPMSLSKEQPAKVQETEGGTYTFVSKVVIDQQSPRITQIQFTSPVQMFDGETLESNGKVVKTITSAETRLYYNENIEVSFSIEDQYLKPSDIVVTVFERAHKMDTWNKSNAKIEIKEQELEEGRKFHFLLPEKDGEYYFTVSCADRAGNQIVYSSQAETTIIGEAYIGGIADGIYQAPIFVKDSQEPEYTVSYNQAPQNYNAVDSIKTVLTITEENLDLDKTIVMIDAKDINGNQVEGKEFQGFIFDKITKTYQVSLAQLLNFKASTLGYQESQGKQVLTLELSTEAHYNVTVNIVDKVKSAITYQKAYCIDRTAPAITLVTKEGQEFTNVVNISSGILDYEKSDVTYSVVNNGWFARIINKLTLGYFAQEKILVHIKVHDLVSGVESFHPTCISEGKEITNYKLSEAKAVEGNPSMLLYEIELPIDFKGTVHMHGVDHAGNAGKDTGGIGMITETETQHKKRAKTEIEVLTSHTKTPNYYAKDVAVKFYAVDGVSGFYQINYFAGEWNETIPYPEGEEICQEETRNYTITANENNLKLGLTFLDNAGHPEVIAQEKIPVVHIDKTRPRIEIVYNNQNVKNEKYYKEGRTATIVITERNFDPNDTIVDISGPSVSLSDWKHIGGVGCKGGSEWENTYHTDDCKWIATVQFVQDGEYTVSCTSTDLAGNQASYGKIDRFIIDRTQPEITVTYDNQNVRNGNYYNAPRHAIITILEQNFEESDVVIMMRAQNTEKPIVLPKVSGWTKDGECYSAKIAFDYDGEFFFDISYTDLAGNQAKDYLPDTFIVDLTAPEIIIFDIKNESANNGVVAPGIRYLDTHHDKNGLMVELKGRRNGIIKVDTRRNNLEKGVEVEIFDLKQVPEMDDLYTLYVTGVDLAGNKSKAQIRFSVNRFGSVYTFDEKTEKLVGENGSYYTNRGKELVIYETNVDTLKFQEITLNCNGKLKTLMEGVDYQVKEMETQDSWKQYMYRIKENNFVEEGLYVLTIYSEDRAENRSDNHTKGKKIEFAVDKTVPSILITGVENKKQYREKSREVIIDVEDNVAMGSLEVMINQEMTKYNALDIAKVHGKLKVMVKDSNDWQTINVTAYDAAGNKVQTEKITFLVTANIFVQCYQNQPLFYGSMGTLVMAGGFFWSFVKKKKHSFFIKS